MYAVTKEILE